MITRRVGAQQPHSGASSRPRGPQPKDSDQRKWKTNLWQTSVGRMDVRAPCLGQCSGRGDTRNRCNGSVRNPAEKWIKIPCRPKLYCLEAQRGRDARPGGGRSEHLTRIVPGGTKCDTQHPR